LIQCQLSAIIGNQQHVIHGRIYGIIQLTILMKT
jgi:hypothetical protein